MVPVRASPIYTGISQGTSTIQDTGTGALYRVRVVPSDFAGTIEGSGTIQPALLGPPPCGG